MDTGATLVALPSSKVAELGLNPDTLAGAEASLEEADMAWVVGTSAVVYPAGALPDLA